MKLNSIGLHSEETSILSRDLNILLSNFQLYNQKKCKRSALEHSCATLFRFAFKIGRIVQR